LNPFKYFSILLGQRIPFDLTCFYSPSEDSTDDENGSDMENVTQKKPRKRRLVKRKTKQVFIHFLIFIRYFILDHIDII
jgi:hypothetical protein